MPKVTTIVVGRDAHKESFGCSVQMRAPDTQREAHRCERDDPAQRAAPTAQAPLPALAPAEGKPTY